VISTYMEVVSLLFSGVCIVHMMCADLSMSVLIGTLKSKEGML